MTRRLLSAAAFGVIASALTGTAGAQTAGYVPGVAECNPQNCGYVMSFAATPGNNIVRSAVYNSTAGISGNLCYRTGYWTPSMAISCRVAGRQRHTLPSIPPVASSAPSGENFAEITRPRCPVSSPTIVLVLTSHRITVPFPWGVARRRPSGEKLIQPDDDV